MMRHTAGRRVRAAFRIAMLAACAAAPARSQSVAVPPGEVVFRESATLDLWYHGLAIVGFESVGPLPYYSVAYGADQRRLRKARGVAPTLLERHAEAYRRDFSADSAFEVLHFVPLYFAELSPDQFLGVMRAVARGGPLGGVSGPQRAGAAAIRNVLPLANQRALLARFVDDLEADWRDAYREQFSRQSEARRPAREELQQRWNSVFAPLIQPAITKAGVTRASIYVVPALGAEGRIVDAPAARTEAVVAVWWPSAAESRDAAAFAAVRELCFPLLRRNATNASNAADSATITDPSERAALDCGSTLLGEGSAAAARYREMFRSAAMQRVSHSSR